MAKIPTVLITGFGPFPGVEHNASARFAKSLSEFCGRRIAGVHVVAGILSTQWNVAPLELQGFVERYKPDVVVHFGVSEDAPGFVLERFALNACDRCEDACGTLPDSGCVVEGAVPRLRSTFPIDLIASRLGANAIANEVSNDAGSYLCNAILFHSLLAATPGKYRSGDGAGPAEVVASPSIIGFVHLPRDLGTSGSELSWRVALKGGLDIVNACCEVWADSRCQ